MVSAEVSDMLLSATLPFNASMAVAKLCCSPAGEVVVEVL
jgi:hypothetical protein